MQKATLYLDNGDKKQVYLLDEKDLENSQNFHKQNFKEHLYTGFLVVGTISFMLGIIVTWKRLNGK